MSAHDDKQAPEQAADTGVSRREFVATTEAGMEQITQRVELTDAVVSSVRSRTGAVGGAADVRELQDVTFSYRSISVENVPTGAVATDSLDL